MVSSIPMSDKPVIGSIGWRDLTVPDAEMIRDFYKDVVGWTSTDHEMEEYSDFNMQDADERTVAGICHSRGANAKIPPQWMIYITVEDVDRAAERCRKLGGEVVDGPRDMGGGRFCVIRDPAGAVAALYAV